MTLFLSEYLKLLQNLTIPGIFYLLGLMIFIQGFTDVNILGFIKDNKKYLLYISILFVIFSFVMSLVLYLAETQFKSILFGEIGNLTPKTEAKEKNYSNAYGVLIMIRHLIYSIIFVVVILSLYSMKRELKTKSKGTFYIIYTLILVILTLAYLKIRTVLVAMACGIPMPFRNILFLFLTLYVFSLVVFLISLKRRPVNH